MIFVFGGAYQGKTEFIIDNFASEKDIFVCKNNIDFSYKVLKLDKFFLHLIENDILPSDYIKNNLSLFKDKIICITDISCGVVSIDKKERLLREEVSRCMVMFSKNADEVYRIMCGISIKMK